MPSSPEVTGKYGEIVPDTRRWSVYGYNDGPDGDGSDIRFDNVERIEVLAAVAKCLAHGSSNVYLHAS